MKDRQIQNFDADFGTERTPEPTEVEVGSPDSTPQPAEVSIGPERESGKVSGIMKYIAVAALGAATVLGGQKLTEDAVASDSIAASKPLPQSVERKSLADRLFSPQISPNKKSIKINVPPVPMKLEVFADGATDPIEILTQGSREIAYNFKHEVNAFYFKAYDSTGAEIKILSPKESRDPNDFIGNTQVITGPEKDKEKPEFTDVNDEPREEEGIYL